MLHDSCMEFSGFTSYCSFCAEKVEISKFSAWRKNLNWESGNRLTKVFCSVRVCELYRSIRGCHAGFREAMIRLNDCKNCFKALKSPSDSREPFELAHFSQSLHSELQELYSPSLLEASSLEPAPFAGSSRLGTVKIAWNFARHGAHGAFA